MSISPKQIMGRTEFIALIAMMFATVAFSIDAMLVAIPDIADEIAQGSASHAAWILTSFVGGMGLGTFFVGPLSDAYGRKPIVYAGVAIYIISAMFAWYSSSLKWILVARFCQGLGAAGPRVVSMAMVRDLFSGREMARIVSIAMTIFILVPALAPAMGQVIINAFGWRSIFGTFIVFSLIVLVWVATRYTESLEVEDRRPLQMGLMIDAVKQLLTHKTVRLSILIQTLMLAMLFSTLISIQPIYDQIYDRAETFSLWFGAVALFSGASSLLNAFIVTRFGMYKVVTQTLFIQVMIGAIVLIALFLFPTISFPLFVFWQFCLFSQAGLTMGNLNAISMEPMGHIAGMATSVVGSISTLGGALIASPVSLFLSDTPAPLIITVLGFGLCAMFLMRHVNNHLTED